MRLLFTILSILLLCLFSPALMAQETTQIETATISGKLIELEGEDGKILVFPSPISGPDGPIIKFVMFGVYETPEVVVDTVKETIYAKVTTIQFTEGRRFFGWFEVPEEEIVSIWINGWYIAWGDMP